MSWQEKVKGTGVQSSSLLNSGELLKAVPALSTAQFLLTAADAVWSHLQGPTYCTFVQGNNPHSPLQGTITLPQRESF